jgi:predicted RNA-binding protein with PUA-like domain
MARRWLVKSDPAHYTFERLARDGRVVWRGVTQPHALSHLRRMKRGDDVLVYHMAPQKAIAGIARVRKGAYPDPAAREGDDLTAVDLAPVRALPRPVPLAEIKRERVLATWELVRVPRLSVMPVPARAWNKVLALSRRR